MKECVFLWVSWSIWGCKCVAISSICDVNDGDNVQCEGDEWGMQKEMKIDGIFQKIKFYGRILEAKRSHDAVHGYPRLSTTIVWF
jgi:hypothetical protein